jgi:hypothetical protein
MAARRRASRRKGCRRNRRNQMGGAGEAYTLGSHVAGAPIINNYGQEIVRFPSCEEAVRPGYLTDAPIKGGLPGFSGGGRRRRGRMMYGGRGDFTTAATAASAQWDVGSAKAGGGQKGGRYTNEFNVVSPNKIALMEPSYSGCGTGLEAINNPLNKGDLASLITAPAPLVSVPTPGSGDQLQKGGRSRRNRRATRRSRRERTRKNRRNQYGGVGGVDSMVYNAPRSGYTTWPSNAQGGDAGTLADGKTPFLINVPFSAQPTPSPACLKTGGRRRSRKAGRKSRKGKRKSRRN